MQELCLQSLGQEDPLEKKMAIHSSILAWEIPWTKEWWVTVHVLQRVRHDLAIKQLYIYICIYIYMYIYTYTHWQRLFKNYYW